MITIFRKIRQKLIADKRASKYLLYAIGEILLVVIGILIALQINNTNELSKQRNLELHYLKNIKTDLILNIKHLENYIDARETAINSANEVIAHYEGKPIKDLKAYCEYLYLA